MVEEDDTQAAALLCADRFSDTLLLSWIIHTRQSRRTVQIFFILDMVLVINCSDKGRSDKKDPRTFTITWLVNPKRDCC